MTIVTEFNQVWLIPASGFKTRPICNVYFSSAMYLFYAPYSVTHNRKLLVLLAFPTPTFYFETPFEAKSILMDP